RATATSHLLFFLNTPPTLIDTRALHAALPILAPTVNAGVAQSVASRSSVTLTGTGTDTNTPVRSLTYLWAQTAGPVVTLAAPTQARTSLTPTSVAAVTAPVTLTFSLTAHNGVA